MKIRASEITQDKVLTYTWRQPYDNTNCNQGNPETMATLLYLIQSRHQVRYLRTEKIPFVRHSHHRVFLYKHDELTLFGERQDTVYIQKLLWQ